MLRMAAFRLEHSAVNRDRLALEPSRRHQPLLHPGEDGAVTLEGR